MNLSRSCFLFYACFCLYPSFEGIHKPEKRLFLTFYLCYFLCFRPFGSCAEVLTPGTVEKFFLPVIVSWDSSKSFPFTIKITWC